MHIPLDGSCSDDRGVSGGPLAQLSTILSYMIRYCVELCGQRLAQWLGLDVWSHTLRGHWNTAGSAPEGECSFNSIPAASLQHLLDTVLTSPKPAPATTHHTHSTIHTVPSQRPRHTQY